MRKDVKKRGGRKRRAYPGGCIFDFASGAIQATDAPNRYVPTSTSRKTAAGSQRNAGIFTIFT